MIKIELLIWVILTLVLILTPLVWVFHRYLKKFLSLFQRLREIRLRKAIKKAKEQPATEETDTSAASNDNTPKEQPQATPDEQPYKTTEVPVNETVKDDIEQEENETDDEQAVEETPSKEEEDIQPTMKEEQEQEQPEPEEAPSLSEREQQQLESIKFSALSYKERGKMDQYEKKLIE